MFVIQILKTILPDHERTLNRFLHPVSYSLHFSGHHSLLAFIVKHMEPWLAHWQLLEISWKYHKPGLQQMAVSNYSRTEHTQNVMPTYFCLNLSFSSCSSLSPSVSLWGRSSAVVPRLGSTVNQQRQPTSQCCSWARAASSRLPITAPHLQSVLSISL